jgi:hypothetical protein
LFLASGAKPPDPLLWAYKLKKSGYAPVIIRWGYLISINAVNKGCISETNFQEKFYPV